MMSLFAMNSIRNTFQIILYICNYQLANPILETGNDMMVLIWHMNSQSLKKELQRIKMHSLSKKDNDMGKSFPNITNVLYVYIIYILYIQAVKFCKAVTTRYGLQIHIAAMGNVICDNLIIHIFFLCDVKENLHRK